MQSLLEVHQLKKTYQGIVAVNDISFEVPHNSIVGLIGPNGSGKSTAIDCITGFQQPDQGRIVLEGQDIARVSAWRIARSGMMRTFQSVRVYDELSLMDNLKVAMYGFDECNWADDFFRTNKMRKVAGNSSDRANELMHLVGLQSYEDLPAGILSYGQKKLVALASCLMSRPKLVILDEPVAGVNPTRIREIEQAILSLKKAGETFLIVEHNMDFISNLCDHVIVLDQGKVLSQGKPDSVRKDPKVLEAYLGIRA